MTFSQLIYLALVQIVFICPLSLWIESKMSGKTTESIKYYEHSITTAMELSVFILLIGFSKC